MKPLLTGITVLLSSALVFQNGLTTPSKNQHAVKAKYELTAGATALINSYNHLFLHRSVCRGKKDTNIYYSDCSSMPAAQYGIYDSAGEVSFVTEHGSALKDSIRTIWDWKDSAYYFYGACWPKKIHFPYPHDTVHNDDVFMTAFVPVSRITDYKDSALWDNLYQLGAIDPIAVKCIDNSFIEDEDGIINRKFPGEYANKKSALGIICILRLKSDSLVPSFLITNDMKNTPLNHVLWKQ